MSVILPSSISYGESLPALPDNTQCINITSAPTNGASFTAGQQIYLDLVNRGFLVPDSMYLSYSYSATCLVNAQMVACPAATSFSRLDVQVGSQTIDTIQNYNIFYNMLSNLTYDVAQKFGNQSALGYFNSTGVPNLEQLDGRLMTANETGSFAFPLVSLLSNSEKLIPLFAMPQVRITLTMDSIANIFLNSPVVVPTAWSISNVQLRYKVVDFGGAVEQIVLGSSDKLYIKSQSFALSSQTLIGGSSGYMELVFNQRYASVKSLFAINGCGAATSNKAFDSVDLTSGNGDYSFMVGGVLYPPAPLSTKTCKASILLELKSAVGSIFDKNNTMSINSVEFGYNGTDALCLYNAPGKFYVGTSLEKLNSNNLLTGISTQNSPISYRISSGGSIGTTNSTVSLVVNYDALIEVDCVTRQVSVKC